MTIVLTPFQCNFFIVMTIQRLAITKLEATRICKQQALTIDSFGLSNIFNFVMFKSIEQKIWMIEIWILGFVKEPDALGYVW